MSDIRQVSDIERLIATEEIKVLKARYFRCVDTRQWDEFEKLFTPDVVFEFPSAKMPPQTLQQFMAVIPAALAGTISVHVGYMPEIEILSSTTARGIWAMREYIEATTQSSNLLGTRVLDGSGYYHETYERENGRWRIKTVRGTRLRIVNSLFPEAF